MNRVGVWCAAGAVVGTVVGTIAGAILLSAQTTQIPEPRRGSGASVTGAFEGWYYNPDGSRSFLVGYYNRNSQQTLDIPIGPNNRIEPGGPDMGQPTHFLPGRQWGMFTIPAPKEFKPTDSYVWTIVANGQTTTIPLRLNPDYVMSPFTEIAVGNTPPVIRFEQGGSARVQGPQANLATAPARTAALATPFPLTVWVTDDLKYTSGSSTPPSASRNPVSLSFSKYRGPGAVAFDKAKPAVEKLPAGEGATVPFGAKATTTVKFSEAGDYVLHVIANDYSGDGGGGFGCCWSTALLKVAVK
ncbi:MAG TPA: hypothetical protein VK504_30465 [Vicinamibacterales bacterium]|nr:hypothetical protein [Vicinamibacterales bacterium]